MKVSSIFKYIFIIFAVGIIAYAGYRIYNNQNKEEENNQDSSTVVEENIIRDLRMGITNYDTMNPLITQNKDIINIDTLIYEPLFNLTKDYQLEPCLAKECSKTGDKIYVVKTVSNAVWHDNTPLTAKDIAFTIDLLKKGNSVYSYNVAHIAETEVIDATTLKITLDSDIPFFEYNLIFPIMSSNYYYGEDFFTSNKMPIGTGRYKITNISSNNVTLAKFDKWKSTTGVTELKLDTEAAEGLLTFHGFKHRQQVYADGRFTVMDDSYNASPASMKAALDVFKGLTGKRHIAVLADMKELGENYLAYHREVGEYAANSGVDLVVTLGEASKCLAEGVRAVKEIPVVEFLDRDEMVKYLEQEVKDGDCILFKGSNSMGLSAVADKFAELAEK